MRYRFPKNASEASHGQSLFRLASSQAVSRASHPHCRSRANRHRHTNQTPLFPGYSTSAPKPGQLPARLRFPFREFPHRKAARQTRKKSSSPRISAGIPTCPHPDSSRRNPTLRMSPLLQTRQGRRRFRPLSGSRIAHVPAARTFSFRSRFCRA